MKFFILLSISFYLAFTSAQACEDNYDLGYYDFINAEYAFDQVNDTFTLQPILHYMLEKNAADLVDETGPFKLNVEEGPTFFVIRDRDPDGFVACYTASDSPVPQLYSACYMSENALSSEKINTLLYNMLKEEKASNSREARWIAQDGSNYKLGLDAPFLVCDPNSCVIEE